MGVSEFESVMASAVEEKIVSGAACVAGRDDGTITFQKAFGMAGAEPDAASMQLNTVNWIASCTKLLTSIAALQCVERGLLELDAPVSKILPEWQSPDILTGFDDSGKPILRKATKEITLRHLLTHSSGCGYTGMHAALGRYWAEVLGNPPDLTQRSLKYSCQLPLVFEPGEGWEYGTSMDWAGQMVERVNGHCKLGEYMQKSIFEVLGMHHSTFRPWDHPDIMKKMGGRTFRDTESGKITLDRSGWFPLAPDLEDDFGGAGLYSCAEDYIKVLLSLLRNDGRLLKQETVEQLFTPQLADPKFLQDQMTSGLISTGGTNGLPKGCRYNHGLGGCLVTDAVEGHCGPNTLFWSGLANSYWFIDRERGVCGMYFSHIFPPADAPTQALNAKFQRFVYTSSSRS